MHPLFSMEHWQHKTHAWVKQLMDSACAHACGSHVSIKSALDLFTRSVGWRMKQNADGVCALARCAGNPKGVVLSHKNVLATVAALQTFVREVGLDLGSDDSTLSYLTLAHILGRALEEFALSVGASIGYWQVRSDRVAGIPCHCQKQSCSPQSS